MSDTQVSPGLWENETCREEEQPSTVDEPLADLLCEALPDFSAPLFLGRNLVCRSSGDDALDAQRLAGWRAERQNEGETGPLHAVFLHSSRAELSQKHAAITIHPGWFLAEDLGSTNGSKLVDIESGEPMPLREGPVTFAPELTLLKFAELCFSVRKRSAAALAPSVREEASSPAYAQGCGGEAPSGLLGARAESQREGLGHGVWRPGSALDTPLGGQPSQPFSFSLPDGAGMTAPGSVGPWTTAAGGTQLLSPNLLGVDSDGRTLPLEPQGGGTQPVSGAGSTPGTEELRARGGLGARTAPSPLPAPAVTPASAPRVAAFLSMGRTIAGGVSPALVAGSAGRGGPFGQLPAAPFGAQPASPPPPPPPVQTSAAAAAAAIDAAADDPVEEAAAAAVAVAHASAREPSAPVFAGATLAVDQPESQPTAAAALAFPAAPAQAAGETQPVDFFRRIGDTQALDEAHHPEPPPAPRHAAAAAAAAAFPVGETQALDEQCPPGGASLELRCGAIQGETPTLAAAGAHAHAAAAAQEASGPLIRGAGPYQSLDVWAQESEFRSAPPMPEPEPDPQQEQPPPEQDAVMEPEAAESGSEGAEDEPDDSRRPSSTPAPAALPAEQPMEDSAMAKAEPEPPLLQPVPAREPSQPQPMPPLANAVEEAEDGEKADIDAPPQSAPAAPALALRDSGSLRSCVEAPLANMFSDPAPLHFSPPPPEAELPVAPAAVASQPAPSQRAAPPAGVHDDGFDSDVTVDEPPARPTSLAPEPPEAAEPEAEERVPKAVSQRAAPLNLPYHETGYESAAAPKRDISRSSSLPPSPFGAAELGPAAAAGGAAQEAEPAKAAEPEADEPEAEAESPALAGLNMAWLNTQAHPDSGDVAAVHGNVAGFYDNSTQLEAAAAAAADEEPVAQPAAAAPVAPSAALEEAVSTQHGAAAVPASPTLAPPGPSNDTQIAIDGMDDLMHEPAPAPEQAAKSGKAAAKSTAAPKAPKAAAKATRRGVSAAAKADVEAEEAPAAAQTPVTRRGRSAAAAQTAAKTVVGLGGRSGTKGRKSTAAAAAAATPTAPATAKRAAGKAQAPPEEPAAAEEADAAAPADEPATQPSAGRARAPTAAPKKAAPKKAAPAAPAKATPGRKAAAASAEAPVTAAQEVTAAAPEPAGPEPPCEGVAGGVVSPVLAAPPPEEKEAPPKAPPARAGRRSTAVAAAAATPATGRKRSRAEEAKADFEVAPAAPAGAAAPKSVARTPKRAKAAAPSEAAAATAKAAEPAPEAPKAAAKARGRPKKVVDPAPAPAPAAEEAAAAPPAIEAPPPSAAKGRGKQAAPPAPPLAESAPAAAPSAAPAAGRGKKRAAPAAADPVVAQGTGKRRRSDSSGRVRVLLSSSISSAEAKKLRTKLERINIVVLDDKDSLDYTHFVMSAGTALKRTRNVLACLAAARPVVSVAWVDACASAGSVVEADRYLIRDSAVEKEFRFKMTESLDSARRNKLLSGQALYVLPGSLAVCDMLCEVAPLAGARITHSVDDATIVLGTAGASAQERSRAEAAKKTVREPEWLLSAIMQQQLP